MFNKALDAAPVLIEELIGDQVKDATTLEHFLLHSVDQSVSQEQYYDQLDSQEDQKGQLSDPGVFTRVVGEVRSHLYYVLV